MSRVWFVALIALSAWPALAAGSISGKVSYSGPAPKQRKLDRKSHVYCAKTEAFDDSLLLASDGKGLRNVVVRLKNGPAAPAPAEPVVIDQSACTYSPRVRGAVAGQRIEVHNSDATLHNVHGFQGKKTVFNLGQPAKARPIVKSLSTDADVVKLKCDVHSWMVSYVVVSKSPFFASSGEDGRFEIKGVPPGKYTIEAWHEKLGTRTAEITVEDGKATDLPIAFAVN
ncbi:MAG: carboxypeptidase regulatory-like domain-containing protein [Myxococcales bacterium]